ncbi:hypothetical protein Nepgr_022754 [Nepenthes gracilis]|uniref:RING-type E3 ubiquitin transferase n=1 Tax=Nepenthes gracilis TaxID=150966 RepID=A0AAD3T2N2_NEPGR|nr:hypothetical protein Nepgr_022754 [Nepenthes gracilis]
MKYLSDDVFYDFTVQEDDDGERKPSASDFDVFQIRIRFRKSRMRTPLTDSEQSFHIPRDVLLSSNHDSQSSWMPFMARILSELQVPQQIQEHMAEHFKFCAERIAMRSSGTSRGGGGRCVLPVLVRIHVRILPPERAAAMRDQIESARAAAAAAGAAMPWRDRPAAVEDSVDEMLEAVPTKTSAIEALEKVWIDETPATQAMSECAICLEEFEVGTEVTKMPCRHIYHGRCILKWLERTHFCPSCRFNMPSES